MKISIINSNYFAQWLCTIHILYFVNKIQEKTFYNMTLKMGDTTALFLINCKKIIKKICT